MAFKECLDIIDGDPLTPRDARIMIDALADAVSRGSEQWRNPTIPNNPQTMVPAYEYMPTDYPFDIIGPIHTFELHDSS